ncbi:MAG TPA: class I SAM-dependent methyltransferase [Gammaproteobacteria bacterium]
MTPVQYDAWYDTPRGQWIGANEFRRLLAALQVEAGASVLDAGCGTGYFTRQLADADLPATGIDPDAASVEFARSRQAGHETYLTGDAHTLPFADRHFDHAIAMTSFCFIEDQAAALRELARVTRCRVALGLLNRNSLLYLRKGRHGGQGGYRGAHWHTPAEARRLFQQAGMPNVTLRSAIYLHDGSPFARLFEHLVPARLLLGAFLLAVADVPAVTSTTS